MSDVTTHLGAALNYVNAPPTDGDYTDGTLADLAQRLDLIDAIQSACANLAAMFTLALAERMEEDRMEIAGVGWLSRIELPPSVKWDRPAVRHAAQSAIISSVCVDPSTGEIRPDWRLAAQRALDMADRTLGLAGDKLPKPYTARPDLLTLLGIDPDEYREVTPRGYTVKIEGGVNHDR